MVACQKERETLRMNQTNTASAIALIEREAVLQSTARIEALVKIFIHATKVGRRTPAGPRNVLYSDLRVANVV